MDVGQSSYVALNAVDRQYRSQIYDAFFIHRQLGGLDKAGSEGFTDGELTVAGLPHVHYGLVEHDCKLLCQLWFDTSDVVRESF